VSNVPMQNARGIWYGSILYIMPIYFSPEFQVVRIVLVKCKIRVGLTKTEDSLQKCIANTVHHRPPFHVNCASERP
jgi:hypothetical protein